MATKTNRRLGFVLFAALLAAPLAAPASADTKDFEFQLVRPEVKQGDDALVAVRLIDKRTKRPVPNAVIFAKRIDMAPEGMASMAAPLTEVASEVPGEYRFKTNLSMEGRWQLSLGARVQGETDAVQSRLILKALP